MNERIKSRIALLLWAPILAISFLPGARDCRLLQPLYQWLSDNILELKNERKN